MVELWIRNDTSSAVASLQKAAQERPPQRRQLLFLGEFLASAGRPDLARDYLRRFEVSVDTATRRRNQPWVHRLLGTVALAERRFPEAIEELRRGDVFPDGPVDACHICLPLALGYAFDRAGRPDSAIAMFERYVNTPYSLRLSHELDPVNLARVLRRLGELHDSLGNREKARDNYSRFVELWEKADPEVQPQVKAVRRRLAELVKEPPEARPGQAGFRAGRRPAGPGRARRTARGPPAAGGRPGGR